MLLAIGLAVGLLIYSCPCAHSSDRFAVPALHSEHPGGLVFLEIDSTNQHSTPNPFGRELMSETLVGRGGEGSRFLFLAFESPGVPMLLATRSQETALYSALDHVGFCRSANLRSSCVANLG